MLNLKEATLKAIAVHKVGNKLREEGYIASESLFPLDEYMQEILQDYFLPPFRAEEYFKFYHESDLALNEVYTYCKQAFEAIGTGALHEQSVNILKHLYAVSAHPQIKSGEVYVAYFADCFVDDQSVDAIGIFKSENKDLFLHFGEESNTVNMNIEEGINIKKLDKGCLIFNTHAEDGFSVMMVDRSSEDTIYWRDDFLHITRMLDSSYHTEAFLNMAKDFCEDVIAREEDKKEQVVFMNKSINFFNENENFDLEGFQEEVIDKPEWVDQFQEYRTQYESEQALDSTQGFPISKYTVRSLRKNFKSVIKLDTEVEIKLTSKDIEEAAHFIERDFDSTRGMYYYKIYFNQEEE